MFSYVSFGIRHIGQPEAQSTDWPKRYFTHVMGTMGGWESNTAVIFSSPVRPSRVERLLGTETLNPLCQ